MAYYRGNNRMGKPPEAASTWGGLNPGRYWRTLERINRRQAASKAVIDARRLSHYFDAWPDDAIDDEQQATLPFPL